MQSFSPSAHYHNNCYIIIIVRLLLLSFYYLPRKKDTQNKYSRLLQMSFRWSLIHYSIYHGKREKHA